MSAYGLVEFGRFLTVRESPSDEVRALSVNEVVDIIEHATEAVAAGLYRRAFGLRRKLDWSLSVSAFVRQDMTGQALPWTELFVDDHALGGRASRPQPAIPTEPFGPPGSFNLPQSAEVRRVAKPMLLQ